MKFWKHSLDIEIDAAYGQIAITERIINMEGGDGMGEKVIVE